MAFSQGRGKLSSLVLFSGQSALPTVLTNSATYSVGALMLLLVCKGLAYGASLSGFRGGPTFPAMFIGAAGGIALSHLPGLPMSAGAAMGIGARSRNQDRASCGRNRVGRTCLHLRPEASTRRHRTTRPENRSPCSTIFKPCSTTTRAHCHTRTCSGAT